MLVTTNDSRVRLFETDGFGCILKFKGNVNNGYQIFGRGYDGQVLCGSDDKGVYLWTYDLSDMATANPLVKKQSGSITTKCHNYEWFTAHSMMTTTAMYIPARAVKTAFHSQNKMILSTGEEGHIHIFKIEST